MSSANPHTPTPARLEIAGNACEAPGQKRSQSNTWIALSTAVDAIVCEDVGSLCVTALRSGVSYPLTSAQIKMVR